jgi:hypothetical protein
MKAKIWVLSTCIPSESAPCMPQVFGSEAAAMAGFDAAMRGEWECNAPTDDDGNEIPYPDGNPEEALRMMADNDPDGEWGRWELTSHDVDVQQTPAAG